jgi:hypothetical protein
MRAGSSHRGAASLVPTARTCIERSLDLTGGRLDLDRALQQAG